MSFGYHDLKDAEDVHCVQCALLYSAGVSARRASLYVGFRYNAAETLIRRGIAFLANGYEVDSGWEKKYSKTAKMIAHYDKTKEWITK